MNFSNEHFETAPVLGSKITLCSVKWKQQKPEPTEDHLHTAGTGPAGPPSQWPYVLASTGHVPQRRQAHLSRGVWWLTLSHPLSLFLHAFSDTINLSNDCSSTPNTVCPPVKDSHFFLYVETLYNNEQQGIKYHSILSVCHKTGPIQFN